MAERYFSGHGKTHAAIPRASKTRTFRASVNHWIVGIISALLSIIPPANAIDNVITDTADQRLDVRIRAFIPHPKYAGAAGQAIIRPRGIGVFPRGYASMKTGSDGVVRKLTGEIDTSFARFPNIIELHPMAKLVECYLGDSRGFSVADDVSSRMVTQFTIIKHKSTGSIEVLFPKRRTHSSPTQRVDCQTGKTTDEQASRVTSDDFTVESVNGEIIIRGHASGKSGIAPLLSLRRPELTPNIDYGYQIKWNLQTDRVETRFRHDQFPSYEFMIKVGKHWEEIFKHSPSAPTMGGLLPPMGEWSYHERPFRESKESVDDGLSEPTTVKRHGTGIYITANGDRHEVEWRHGKRHGSGRHQYADGSISEGKYQDDQRHGKWITVGKYGSHEAEWRNGKQHGSWSETSAYGSRIVGRYRDDQRHGKWITVDKDGSRYEENWRDGKLQGYVNHTYAIGGSIEGKYRDGKRHGKWIEVDPSGSRFEMNYRNGKLVAGAGKPTGEGIITSPDGRKYKGEWFHFEPMVKAHGKGLLTYRDGSKYEGEWREGQRHGRGTYSTVDGSLCEIEFQHGLRHGVWNCKFGDGGTLQEQWYEGKLHENWTFVSRSGKRLKEKWSQGKLLGDSSFQYDDGERRWLVRQIEWRDGKLNCKGEFLDDSADRYEGDFIDKVVDGVSHGNFLPCRFGGHRHGVGAFTTNSRFLPWKWLGFESNYVYRGQWVKDKMHGQGILSWPNGDSFEGIFQAGTPYGEGKWTISRYLKKPIFTTFEKGKQLLYQIELDSAMRTFRAMENAQERGRLGRNSTGIRGSIVDQRDLGDIGKEMECPPGTAPFSVTTNGMTETTCEPAFRIPAPASVTD